jgi:hypothetical protein
VVNYKNVLLIKYIQNIVLLISDNLKMKIIVIRKEYFAYIISKTWRDLC